ncbi:MAG: hypothetical protein CSA35_02025 [Dethiosulfovibrio peptidovorans]|nr:MAG: hypothetical protein CSA35_02025 [Dethiosulfovibrio peptidovorans]
MKRGYGRFAAIAVASVALLVLAWGVAAAQENVKGFIDSYYRAVEQACEDGQVEPLRSFVDMDTDYGKDTLSWILRLHEMGVSMVFDDVQVETHKAKGDEVELSVQDRLTLTYPDERVRTFAYTRTLVIRAERIVDGRSEFRRVFPAIEFLPEKPREPMSAKGVQARRPEEDVNTTQAASLNVDVRPESFLPPEVPSEATSYLRWNEPKTSLEILTKGLLEPEMLQELTGEWGPQSGPGALSVSLTWKDDLDDLVVTSMFGALQTLPGTDPLESVKSVFRNSDVELEEFKGTLTSDLEPVGILRYPSLDLTLSVALWVPNRQVVLFSQSDEGLNLMAAVGAGQTKGLDLSCPLGKGALVRWRASATAAFLQKVLEDKIPCAAGEERLKFDGAVYREENRIDFRWSANVIKHLGGDEFNDGFLSIGPDLKIYGGPALAVMAARLRAMDRETFEQICNKRSKMKLQEIQQRIAPLTEASGLTLDDILALLGGRLSVMVSGKSSSPVGDVPGLYIQLEPEDKSVLDKVASALPRFEDIGCKKVKLKGWNSAYGMDGLFSITAAVRDDRLLLGFLDHKVVKKEGAPAKAIASDVEGSGGDLGILALSVTDLRHVVENLLKSDSELLQNEELQKGLQEFLTVSERIAAVVLRSSSRRDACLSILVRE